MRPWFEDGRYYADTVEDDAQAGTSPALDQARRCLMNILPAKPRLGYRLHVQGTPSTTGLGTVTDDPYGHLVTYGELAKRVAKLRHRTSMSAQAVGNAVGKTTSPCSSLPPGHRGTVT